MTEKPQPPFPPQPIDPPGEEHKMDPSPQYSAPDYQGSGKLEGKVALITGGDSGIGRSVAVLYAREGADVAIVYLPEEQQDAEETKAAVEQEGQSCLLCLCDVRDTRACEEVVAKVIDQFGHLDILVNNAAFQRHCDSIDDLTFEQWETTLHTNLSGYFHMVKASLPHLSAGSAIIQTGSITGLKGSAALLDYSATKGGIHAFTKSLAQHLVERRIRVNCVAPGPVWTPLNPAERSRSDIQNFGKGTPYERPAQPEEIAPAFVFFASNADSSFITGEVLTLLGGQTTAG